MNKPLHLLIIEDSEDDTLLLLRELERGGYDPFYERVENAMAMQAALDRQNWEVIVADFNLPHFSAPAALALLKESRLDLPFIIVSGTVSEEAAVAAMKAGAHDYLNKGSLARLAPAIERELREAEVRRERRQAEAQIKASLREKEILLREVHHRVRNNLQGILNLLYLQALHVSDPATRQLFQKTQDRVRSIALIHETLYETHNLAYLDLTDYVTSLVEQLINAYGVDPTQIRVNISLDHVLLNVDTAVPLGVIINELVSNALKHAFPPAAPALPAIEPLQGGQVGEIAIELRTGPQQPLTLSVRDNGVGLPADIDVAQPKTLGLQLVSLLAQHMAGTVACHRQAGTAVTVTLVPLEESSNAEVL